MQDYKIRIPNTEVSRQVQDKAIELGWGKNQYIYDNLGEDDGIFLFLYQPSLSPPSWSRYEDYFNQHHNPEISYQDFLRLGEQSTINNKTTEIMSEITLKCITAPQKAKNITVDRDYTGILTDSDDTQVDTLREATHFRCVNNNGIEAKYRLSLFASIEPPTPPAPPKITQKELIDSLIVDQDEVLAVYNGSRFTVVNLGLSDLNTSEVNCSCGIKSCDGLNSLMYSIYQTDWEHISEIVSDFNEVDFEKDLFKLIVKNKIDNYTVAIILFSTTEDEEIVCNLMDSICDERNGWQTDFRRNPNSGNIIKAWLIPKI